MEAIAPYTVRRTHELKSEVSSPKWKGYREFADYVFAITNHAYDRNKNFLWILKCKKNEPSFKNRVKVWYITLRAGDTNSKGTLYKILQRPDACLNEEIFREGRIHDYVRNKMNEYR